MTKKEKFLLVLEEELKKRDFKNSDKILKKYSNIINKKIKNGEKITKILKELTVESIILKEQSETFLKNKLKKLIKKLKIQKETITKKNNNTSSQLAVSDNIIFKNEELDTTKEIKNTFKNKKVIKIILKVLLNIILLLLTLLFLWVTVIFTSSIFMILDGVKFYGLTITLLFLTLFIALLLFILNKYIMNIKIYFKKTLIVLISLIFLIGVSGGITLYQYYHFEEVDEVTDKYSMTRYTEVFDLSSDKDSTTYLYFNSWYKNKYVIKYDNNLKDKYKIEIEYYECYYDLYTLKKLNSLYVSLDKDFRDIISIHLENLKEKKIYNEKELSRISVVIRISEEDANRLIIVD